jgi:hypothetical protein
MRRFRRTTVRLSELQLLLLPPTLSHPSDGPTFIVACALVMSARKMR